MDTKKCPRCGEEIPSEMQFCLHCMERTDGVLEIRQKSRSRTLPYLLAGIAVLLLAGIALLLIFLLRSDKQEETNLPMHPDETITTVITPTITETDTAESTQTDTEALQETAAIPSDVPAVSTTNTPQENPDAVQTNAVAEKPDTNTAPIQTQLPIASESDVQTTTQAVTEPPASIVTEPPATQAPVISFEQRITDGLANWGGSNVDASTLVFSGNSCTFTANASGSPLSCTLESNAECTAFTLVMAQQSPYAAYSPGTYVPDLTNTFSSILLGHSLSSGMRGDIRTMFNNFGTQQVFTENGYSYIITAEKQNDGTKTVTVTASIS